MVFWSRLLATRSRIVDPLFAVEQAVEIAVDVACPTETLDILLKFVAIHSVLQLHSEVIQSCGRSRRNEHAWALVNFSGWFPTQCVVFIRVLFVLSLVAEVVASLLLIEGQEEDAFVHFSLVLTPSTHALILLISVQDLVVNRVICILIAFEHCLATDLVCRQDFPVCDLGLLVLLVFLGQEQFLLRIEA